eukprot:1324913-Amorphochlora_amoeboformis.AAC.1
MDVVSLEFLEFKHEEGNLKRIGVVQRQLPGCGLRVGAKEVDSRWWSGLCSWQGFSDTFARNK